MQTRLKITEIFYQRDFGGNINILKLKVSVTKIDDTFTTIQFVISGSAKQLKFDRKNKSWYILIYKRKYSL